MEQPPCTIRNILARLSQPTGTITPALLGSVLCWLAFPPVGWSWLAWVGPLPWLVIVQKERLGGSRPYRALWLGGMVFWLLTVHWIRLPHPANYLAWVALAGYLGAYLPAFVALARVGVHRLRLPLTLVAPIVWVGLDWLRGHLLTGFSMGSLAHTQADNLRVIQIADLAGEYLVTFVILLVAASLTKSIFFIATTSEPGDSRARRLRPFLHLLPAVLALIATVLYGNLSTTDLALQQENQSAARIALIQGNYLADWKSDEDKQRRIMDEQRRLSHQAVRENRDVDLVIWPETSFRQTLVTLEQGYSPPAERLHESHLAAARDLLREFTSELGTAMLVGVDRTHIFPGADGEPDAAYYNSSVLADKQGELLGTYDKMHRVPFGEYIPLAEWFPSLYQWTPLTGGIQAGAAPAAMRLEGVIYAVNICYETAVPHLIRRHVVELAALGQRPDVLVNLTNDAWYWGSSELDMHLACGVFRAVEMRLPMVIAANGGLSGYIDAAGRVRQVTQRQTPTYLIVDVNFPQVDASLYNSWGDWLAIFCVLCCMVLVVVGYRGKKAESPSLKSAI